MATSLFIKVLSAAVALLALWLVQIVRKQRAWFRHNARIVQHIPGYRLLVHPHHLAALALPRRDWLNLGEQYTWRHKHDLFKRGKGVDVLSVVSAVPQLRSLIVSDAQAVRYVMTERRRFVKPLAMFGQNVGVVEGSEWLRHRKIVAGPAFAEATNQTAWNETTRVLDMCFDDWSEGDVRIDSMVALTLKSVAAAAFSQRPPWRDDAPESLQPGHTLSFRQALHGVLENVFARMLIPSWAFRLPIKRFRHVDASFTELETYFRRMIAERRESGFDARESDTGRRDLLGALVHASAGEDDGEKGRAKLDDSEVMGNIYVFLLAGHDTTAHTLAFAFSLLALYPDVQQRLLNHINEVVPSHRNPTFDDVPKLNYVLAVFLETLRLYPSVVVIPRYCVADSTIPVVRQPNGQAEQVYVPAGGEVFVDAVALHYNPVHWPDPHAFKPERFMDENWPREAFMGFSAGARTCLGQKFAQVEAIAVLSYFVRRYQIMLAEDADGTAPKDETLDQKRARITRCKTVITLTPQAVPFVLKPRQRA